MSGKEGDSRDAEPAPPSGFGEPVAETPPILDDSGTDLAPQAKHQRFDRVGIGGIRRPVEMLGNLYRGTHPSALMRHNLEEAIFERRKSPRAIGHRGENGGGYELARRRPEARAGERPEERSVGE